MSLDWVAVYFLSPYDSYCQYRGSGDPTSADQWGWKAESIDSGCSYVISAESFCPATGGGKSHMLSGWDENMLGLMYCSARLLNARGNFSKGWMTSQIRYLPISYANQTGNWDDDPRGSHIRDRHGICCSNFRWGVLESRFGSRIIIVSFRVLTQPHIPAMRSQAGEGVASHQLPNSVAEYSRTARPRSVAWIVGFYTSSCTCHTKRILASWESAIGDAINGTCFIFGQNTETHLK